jgi:methanogenic corrinoid protein MtbC1
MLTESLYRDYFSHLVAGRRTGCREIVHGLLDDGIEVRQLYTDLFQRALYEVGELWETHRISVAVEHLATAITEHLMSMAYPRVFSHERVGRTAVVASVANEYHQIGGRMVADMFELHGWDGHFLGANTPLTDLVRFIEGKNPEIVGLSLSIYYHVPELMKVLDELSSHVPGTRVLIGGQAFRKGGSDVIERYENVRYIKSLEELEYLIDRN